MAGTQTPLLSICIPTLNRASILEDALASLRPEVISLGDAVEVVVSDNCSTDGTDEVLRRNSDWVRWSRSERTTGFTGNMLRASCDLARGRFVWLVGDDDLVIRGALTRVVESLKSHPDVAYHYLNFGWLNVHQRHRIIHELDSTPPLFPARPGSFQCDDFGTHIFPRIEDLAFLPSRNPSVLFSGFFCFVVHREIFVNGRVQLKPRDNLYPDASSTLLDDDFPHAVMTLPQLAGKPVVFIGEPCLLQGTGGWEWEDYACKTMIFGIYQLFTWLGATSFAQDAMATLWQSYYAMAGRLFHRMLTNRQAHHGIEIVLREAIPSAAGHLAFWDSFAEESRTNEDARLLSQKLAQVLVGNPSAKIGLWGVGAIGLRLVKLSTEIGANLKWAADEDTRLHGVPLAGTSLRIAAIDTLKDVDLDILVVAESEQSASATIIRIAPLMRRDVHIVSVCGDNFLQPK